MQEPVRSVEDFFEIAVKRDVLDDDVLYRGQAGADWQLVPKIDRREFGLKFNKAMDTGGLIVGNSVEIELNIEAVKK